MKTLTTVLAWIVLAHAATVQARAVNPNFSQTPQMKEPLSDTTLGDDSCDAVPPATTQSGTVTPQASGIINPQLLGTVTPQMSGTSQLSGPVTPQVSGTPQVVGYVSDPTLNRDSCSSAMFNGRALWTCRDTESIGSDGKPSLPILSSSASWTDFNSDGTIKLQTIQNIPDDLGTTGLLMYGNNQGQAFFPLGTSDCNGNSAGACSDGTRFVLWPSSRPMVSESNADGSVVAYTWITNAHISGLTPLIDNPATSLYRINYQTEADGDTALPTVTLVNKNFWAEGSIAYGFYGSLVQNDIAYLWGQSSDNVVALAKVPVTSIEDTSQYQYWVNNGWTSTQPRITAAGINIPNVSAGGQGTYYYSAAWSSYVWIGQATMSVSADFYITTAPDPTGPWITPIKFYSAENGNGELGAYSLQAHPDLGSPYGANSIYVTYTKSDTIDGIGYYSTPLILVEWA